MVNDVVRSIVMSINKKVGDSLFVCFGRDYADHRDTYKLIQGTIPSEMINACMIWVV